MITELTDTSSRDIAAALIKARRTVGTASGLVLTLLIVTDGEHFDEVLAAAQASATAHPSRVIVVTYVDAEEPQLDATIQVGEGHPGDLLILRLHGRLREHGDSICLPLLLPDSPTIVWWPNNAPDNLALDPIGSLADRRITDAASAPDPQEALILRARNHAAGDTDLTWTRLTRWRALLAASLEQTRATITGACVRSAPDNAPATLLAAWLSDRLGVDVTRVDGDGIGVNEVVLNTDDGDIVLSRVREGTAHYRVPGEPERSVALRRRPLTDLLTEELQRMDADDIFERTVQKVLEDSEAS